jgi:AraC-like DNA-binding protein
MSRRRPSTALASTTQQILRWAEGRGIPKADLVTKAVLAELARAGDGARVPLELHVSVWRSVERALADPAFALKSAPSILDVSSLGLVGLLAMTSNNVGDSLARSVKYSRVLKDDVVARLSVLENELVVELWTTEPLTRSIMDASLFAFRHYAETWTGGAVLPKAAFFRHQRPADASEYERFGCPVHFGHAVDAIVFDREASAAPLVTAQPEVAHYLEKAADLWLTQHVLQSGDLHARLTTIIREALDEGHWEIDDVARRLGMSARTLQRELAAQQLSYRRILDEVRWSVAGPLVTTTEMPFERIAERLGYADGKAFRRAFRRWAGVAPVVLRQNAAKGET